MKASAAAQTTIAVSNDLAMPVSSFVVRHRKGGGSPDYVDLRTLEPADSSRHVNINGRLFWTIKIAVNESKLVFSVQTDGDAFGYAADAEPTPGLRRFPRGEETASIWLFSNRWYDCDVLQE